MLFVNILQLVSPSNVWTHIPTILVISVGTGMSHSFYKGLPVSQSGISDPLLLHQCIIKKQTVLFVEFVHLFLYFVNS